MDEEADDESLLESHNSVSIWRVLVIICVSAAFVVSGSLQQVCFKRMGYSLGPYPYAILLSVSAAMCIPLLLLLLFIRCSGAVFAAETLTLSFHKHFFVIGALNAVNGVFIIFSNPHVLGSLQAVLSQATIPFVMLLSVFYLKTRFSVLEVVGSLVVLAGVVVYLIPSFLHRHSHAHPSPHTNAFWTCLFIVGQIPSAMASVYQEKAFARARVNVVHMMTWSCIAQFVAIVVLLPCNVIPHFGDVRNMRALLTYFADAGKCFVGTGGSPGACKGAAMWWSLGTVTMMSSGLLQAVLVKMNGATYTVLISTLITPLAAVSFTFHWLMGQYVEHMPFYGWISLCVLMIGIVFYRFGDQITNCIRMRTSSPDESPFATVEPHTEPSVHFLQPQIRREKAPRIVSSRVGVVVTEYSAAKRDRRGILFEHTFAPAPRLGSIQGSSAPF